MSNILDKKVTVCGACETAACWQGSFMCDHAEFSGTKEFTVRELHTKPRGENVEYWFKNVHTGEIDRRELEEFRETLPCTCEVVGEDDSGFILSRCKKHKSK